MRRDLVIAPVARATRTFTDGWTAIPNPPVPASGWIEGLWSRLDAGLRVSVVASRYHWSAGWRSVPHVAMPGASYLAPGGTTPRQVRVCVGTRCVTVPVVDSCECYAGTLDSRGVDMSASLVSELGLDPALGLYEVTLELVPATG